jgi:hypothetical protein
MYRSLPLIQIKAQAELHVALSVTTVENPRFRMIRPIPIAAHALPPGLSRKTTTTLVLAGERRECADVPLMFAHDQGTLYEDDGGMIGGLVEQDLYASRPHSNGKGSDCKE